MVERHLALHCLVDHLECLSRGELPDDYWHENEAVIALCVQGDAISCCKSAFS